MRQTSFRKPLSKVQILSNHISPHPLKIHTQKLPSGFFSQLRTPSRQPSTARSKLHSKEAPQSPLPTIRKQQISFQVCKTASSSRVQLSTSEDVKDNDDYLINGLIDSTRNIKRMIRKHSLQLRKQQRADQFIQLPPLKIIKANCIGW